VSRPGLERRRLRSQFEADQAAMRLPAEVFVVCVKGEPIAVCLDETSTRQELAEKNPREVRVFGVPLR